jgi:methionyl-tRNA formyltransferase
MGTPDFAASTLAQVLASKSHEIAGVYSQPDRPCGRGHKCTPSPVKVLALEHGLPVFQPLNFKEPAAITELAELEPDVLLVAAYGLILPRSVLDIPKLGPWNVHASLLPKYRGAAPIQRAILDGASETGITIMRMEAGLDTGPTLLRRAISIGSDETAGSVHDRLAELGGELALEALTLLGKGSVHPEPQVDSQATYAPKLTKDDTLIRWDQTVQKVHNRIRAMSPKPGAFFTMTIPGENRHIRLQVLPGTFSQVLPSGTAPGTFLGLSGGGLCIACADGIYSFSSVKPSGKNFMDASAFACGYLSKIDPDVTFICPPPDDLLSS